MVTTLSAERQVEERITHLLPTRRVKGRGGRNPTFTSSDLYSTIPRGKKKGLENGMNLGWPMDE